jgi:hypothetical protein
MKIFKSENELITLLKWDNLRLEQAIARVRELHSPFWVNEAHCSECYSKYDKDGKYSLYPCDTIKALDGEQ